MPGYFLLLYFDFQIVTKSSIFEIITEGGMAMRVKKGEELQDNMNEDAIEELVEDGEVENEDQNDETEE